MSETGVTASDVEGGGTDSTVQEPRSSTPDKKILEIQNKISSAYDIFDHENNKTVDIREVGTIIRSLGCCPSEAELHDLLTEMEDEESPGYVKYEHFLVPMTRVLMERRYKPAHKDMLMKAFQLLDADCKGYLTVDEATKYLTTEGETFNSDEMEEFLSAAVDPDSGNIVYRKFVPELVVDDFVS